jgi:hypothetical protein
MTKNKHLVEIINKYSFSIVELHEKLNLKGEYFENGLYEGRSPDEVNRGISPDTDRHYVKNCGLNVRNVYF